MSTKTPPVVIAPSTITTQAGHMAYSTNFIPPVEFASAIEALKNIGLQFERVAERQINLIDRELVHEAGISCQYLAQLLYRNYSKLEGLANLVERLTLITDAQPYWENCEVRNSHSIIEIDHVGHFVEKTIRIAMDALQTSDDDVRPRATSIWPWKR